MIDAIYNFLEGLGYTHPIHAPLTHMPEGLVAGALVFALAAWAFRRSRLAVTARHCLILALIFLFPTAIAGYMDWQHFYGGAWLTIFKIKLLLTGLLLILLIVCLLFIPEDRPRYAILLPLYFLCFLAVAVLGYLGGQLALGERCFEAPPGAFSAGARIFRVNCSACHPQGGNIINPKLPVMGSPELANSQAFLTYLRNPTRPGGSRGSMPPFPAKRIPDPEVKELYAYIINVLEKKGR